MKISVILACGRDASAAARSLDSVLDQQVADCEIILAGRGAEELAAPFAGRANVTAVETQGGRAAARNAGLARAAGDYVGFLDAGDRWGSGVLAKTIADLDTFAWADGLEIGVRLADAEGDVHPQQLARIANGLAANLVLRRESVRALGGFPTDPRLGIRGGDAAALRFALRRWGTLGAMPQVQLEHSVRDCDLSAYVMAATRGAGDRVESDPPDAAVRAADEAIREHLRRLDQQMLDAVGAPPLHAIPCELNGRRFEFEVVDRPEFIGQATAAILHGEYPILPFLGSVQTIVEVGAGGGANAVHFASTHPAARIIALEPNPLAFVLLRRNTAAQPRIESYKLGLFNTTTRLDFVAGEGAPRERVLVAEAGLFLQSLRVERIDILRLDNKGLEVMALLGMGERLRETKAIILRYYRDGDRRVIDELLAASHLLYWGRSTRPHNGEFLYVQRALLGPDGRR